MGKSFKRILREQTKPHAYVVVCIVALEWYLSDKQGWFYACAQPMRDVVTK